MSELGGELLSASAVETLPPTEPVPLIYTNSVQVQLSLYDVTLQLGNIVDVDADTHTVKVKHTAHVVMSPQHAKALLAALAKTVQQYEAMIGPIPSGAPRVPSTEPQPPS